MYLIGDEIVLEQLEHTLTSIDWFPCERDMTHPLNRYKMYEPSVKRELAFAKKRLEVTAIRVFLHSMGA